jgi:hypothetical protein
MVQTKEGVAGNPWIAYMRACAANYHAGRAQVHVASGKAEPKARASAKGEKMPAKPVGEKEVEQLKGAVKQGQERKKGAAAQAATASHVKEKDMKKVQAAVKKEGKKKVQEAKAGAAKPRKK